MNVFQEFRDFPRVFWTRPARHFKLRNLKIMENAGQAKATGLLELLLKTLVSYFHDFPDVQRIPWLFMEG